LPYVLGIDTGGTFTDGVLLDADTKTVVAKAKAFTTHEDLAKGIRECIGFMPYPLLAEVGLVSLSTTLATNAIVEGHGCRVGLVLIGAEAPENLPAQKTAMVRGGHDISGEPREALDTAGLKRCLQEMAGEVDVIAVSGYLSVRNPDHEQTARRMARELLGVPVVCAHELTTVLGYRERTVTACLNARLLLTIADLLAAVKKILAERNIQAPLMVVKGDGSLMSEETAREKPIETILSGPAASIVGATFLTRKEKALILDMGGTTTDIAVIEDGRPALNREGATVGGWKTRVEAAEISTFGLGGDSYLRVDQQGELLIGPQRVVPLCVAAMQHPHLVGELREVDPAVNVFGGQPVDCWLALRPPDPGMGLGETQKRIMGTLREGAHNVLVLAGLLGCEPDLLPLKGLEDAGLVKRISFTPTDVLHALGRFREWRTEAAVAGSRILAGKLNMEPETFLPLALTGIKRAMTTAVLQSLAHRTAPAVDLAHDRGARFFLDRFFAPDGAAGIKVTMQMDLPIVGIGAPARAYVPSLGEALRTGVVIPENAEVANAVGAASGKVVAAVRILIKPGDGGGFLVHAPWGREFFLTREDAEDRAVTKGRASVAETGRRAGTRSPEIVVAKREVLSNIRGTAEKMFIEEHIEVMAVGEPSWR